MDRVIGIKHTMEEQIIKYPGCMWQAWIENHHVKKFSFYSVASDIGIVNGI